MVRQVYLTPLLRRGDNVHFGFDMNANRYHGREHTPDSSRVEVTEREGVLHHLRFDKRRDKITRYDEKYIDADEPHV